MLILVYSHSDDFLSRHEYAITADGHQCICSRSDDDAINLIRTRPVDVIYLHTASIADGYKRLMFGLNAFNNGGALVFACSDLDITDEPAKDFGKGLHDTVFTCGDDPRPFIAHLRALHTIAPGNGASTHASSCNNASLQTFAIDNTSFNWNFSCHADIAAIRDNDILERITRGSQSFQIPIEHYRNVLIILTELYNNAVDHGVLGLPSELKQGAEGFAKFYELRLSQLNKFKTGFVDVSLSQLIIDGTAELSISFKDSGKGFDYDTMFKKEITEKAYGRGLIIINKLCKSIEYSGSGNEVTVIYEWPI